MVPGKGASSSKGLKAIECGRGDGTNSSGAARKKFSALVVDDDPVVQRIHKVLLNKQGLETQVVGNGKEAVDLFCSGACFDLVIMDMEMPVMDGPQATRMLRTIGVNSMIVGVTSRARESEKKAFMEAGLNDCYAKPLTAAKITSLLQELCGNHN